MWLRGLSFWSQHELYSYVTTGGPPFALELCARKLAAAKQSELDAIDLSGVQSIILGAEPVRASALLAFAAATESLGFSPNAYMPAYGLAENVLHVCGKKDCTYPPTLLHVETQVSRQRTKCTLRWFALCSCAPIASACNARTRLTRLTRLTRRSVCLCLLLLFFFFFFCLSLSLSLSLLRR